MQLILALDEGMLLGRRLDARSLRSLRTLVSKCLRELDLDEELRRRLKKDALRRHVVVPVPGLL